MAWQQFRLVLVGSGVHRVAVYGGHNSELPNRLPTFAPV
jgi:hypothetical protein